MNKKPETAVRVSPLDAVGLALLETRLREQASDLQRRMAEHKHELTEEASATSNTFVAGDEGARAAEEDDEVLAQLKHEESELLATQAALQRMQDGLYGWCEVCDEAIGMSRLLVVPQATTCADCQRSLEKNAARR